MIMGDDDSNNGPNKIGGYVDEKKWPDVFLKALEREGVTEIMFFELCCSDVGIALVNHFKSIKVRGCYNPRTALYHAAGFAAGDKGDKDRPGVCVTSANSGILAHDVVGKCRRLGEKLPVVCIIGSLFQEYADDLLFNDEPLMSLPHYYHILDVRDTNTVVQQAFSSAYSKGGPVFIDIQHLSVDCVEGYIQEHPSAFKAESIARYLKGEGGSLCAMYVSPSWDGAGVGNANDSELRRFVELTGIPVTRSLVGLAKLNTVVIYLGVTSNDLPAIVALDATGVIVLPVDAGDDEITKIIKNPIHIPTLKEINEMLVQIEGISDWSSWAQKFFEDQRILEDTLTSCYADIFTTELEANNNNRITREVAIQVLDEFFETNKAHVSVIRNCETWKFGTGASAANHKHIFVVSDGFELDIRNNFPYPRGIILDNTGWTKRFYHETQKVFSLVDEGFKYQGDVVMNKSDLEDALYDRMNDVTGRIEGFLVVAVAPPPNHQEIMHNFSRDIRFVGYPTDYVCNLVDKD